MWNPLAPSGFLRRNKRQLAIGAVVLVSVGTGALYLYRKYQEISAASERKQLFRAKLHFQYENNRRTADSALRSQLTQLKLQICKEIDLEAMTARLKEKGSLTADEKKRMWEQVKILSFTRTLVSVYSLSLMNLLINTQLSIIGRYLFAKYMENEEAAAAAAAGRIHLQQNASLPTGTNLSIPNQVQQTFLSYVLYMQTKGLQLMLPKIQSAVEQHVSSMTLREPVSAEELNLLIAKIRQTIDSTFIGTSSSSRAILDNDEQPSHILVGIADVLLPPEGHDDEFFKTDSSDSLKIMVDELRDLIDSVEFQTVYTEILDQSFSVLAKHIAKFFVKKQTEPESSSASSVDQEAAQEQPAAARLPVAYLIPYVTKEVKNVFSLKENEQTRLSENEYLKRMQHVERLNVFCAMIYSMNLPL